jgi:ferredoxin-fold anticodon binding domain-containing protein
MLVLGGYVTRIGTAYVIASKNGKKYQILVLVKLRVLLHDHLLMMRVHYKHSWAVN